MSDLSYLPKYVKMINYKISVKSIKYPIAFEERIMKLRRFTNIKLYWCYRCNGHFSSH